MSFVSSIPEGNYEKMGDKASSMTKGSQWQKKRIITTSEIGILHEFINSF